jgi:hypothetical protein
VTFNIFEFPDTVLEVIYHHAKHISQRELQDLMPQVRKGLPLNLASNIKACQDIQDFLKAKGRYWANVTLEEGARPTDRRVIFNISLCCALDSVQAVYTLSKSLDFCELTFKGLHYKRWSALKRSGSLSCRASRMRLASPSGRATRRSTKV